MKTKKNAVTVVGESKNQKTGKVAATYAPIEQTCPKSCSLRDQGCYAQNSYTGLHVERLEKAAGRSRPLGLARLEARLVAALRVPSGRPLRLHVSGDARTNEAAKALAKGVNKYRANGGGPAWTYTHAWRQVDRQSWGSVSVLASCETEDDAFFARGYGYAAALVVDEHPENGKAWRDSYGAKWIPCPAQTAGVQCIKCRLCFDADRLHDQRSGIAFAVHGSRKKKALKVLNNGT